MHNNVKNNITMDTKPEQYPSTFNMDNFSSTKQLTSDENKPPVAKKKSFVEKLYDIYEHRILEHPNTFLGALMHVVKSSLGTGILAMPMAFMYSGLIVGAIGTVLAGFLMVHTINILVVASHKMCTISRVPFLSFSDTAGAVFQYGPKPLRPWASFARLFVDIGLSLTYFFGCGVYVVFIGDSLEQIMHYFFPHDDIPRIFLILGATVLLIFFCQIRPLKFLVPFSVIANITMLTAFAITFYYMFKKIPTVPLEERSLSKGIGGLPKFMVTIVFALEGIGTIMPVENSMQKPQFIGCPGVLNIGVSILVLTFGTIGFFGYYAYGELTKASVTYNLEEEDLAMIGRCCITIAVFFTFMLQFYVPMEITWRNVIEHVPPRYHNIFQILCRIAAVVFISIIAIIVPDLSTIIDIVGSVFLATLGLFVPCFLDVIVNWETGHGKFHWKLFKNVFIMCMSIFILCSGVYFAVSSLINPTEN